MPQNAFTELLSRQQTVFSGPKATYNAEPAIQGYYFAVFKLPDEIAKHLKEFAQPQFAKTTDSEFIFASALRSIDLPNPVDLQTTQKQGLAGTRFTVVTGITTPDSISMTFYEYYGHIVTKFVYAWITKIFDPVTGLSGLSELTQSKYKSTIDIAFFDPAGSTVQSAYRMYGVFPTQIPLSGLGSDITANGIAEVTVQFAMDRIVYLPCLEAEIQSILISEAEKLKGIIGKC